MINRNPANSLSIIINATDGLPISVVVACTNTEFNKVIRHSTLLFLLILLQSPNEPASRDVRQASTLYNILATSTKHQQVFYLYLDTSYLQLVIDPPIYSGDPRSNYASEHPPYLQELFLHIFTHSSIVIYTAHTCYWLDSLSPLQPYSNFHIETWV